MMESMNPFGPIEPVPAFKAMNEKLTLPEIHFFALLTEVCEWAEKSNHNPLDNEASYVTRTHVWVLSFLFNIRPDRTKTLIDEVTEGFPYEERASELLKSLKDKGNYS